MFVMQPDAYSASSPNCSLRLASARSCFLSLAALVFARVTSIFSLMARSRAASALALWIWRVLVADFGRG
jgi:hypothetical protein